MQRNTKIFIIIAVPVVVVLITIVVIIAASLETCKDNTLCVVLNKQNESKSDKVYEGGLYVINPSYHFSHGLPMQGHSLVGGVQTQNESIKTDNNATTELGVFVVFKFYIKKENVFKFFEALPKNFSSDEYDVATLVQQQALPIVTEVLGLWNCSEYFKYKEDEQHWIDLYAEECRKRFEEANMLFTLDEEKPIKAVFLFDGCGYD